MPLVDQLSSLNFDSLNGSLSAASTLLANANVTVTVNGAPQISVTGILGIQPLLDAADNIPTDPAKLGDAVKAMLKELEGLAAIPKLGGIAEIVEQFGGTTGVLRQIGDSFGGSPDAVIDRIFG